MSFTKDNPILSLTLWERAMPRNTEALLDHDKGQGLGYKYSKVAAIDWDSVKYLDPDEDVRVK